MIPKIKKTLSNKEELSAEFFYELGDLELLVNAIVMYDDLFKIGRASCRERGNISGLDVS